MTTKRTRLDDSILTPRQSSSINRNGTNTQQDWEYLEIVLKRELTQSGGFGFSIAGGIDAPIADGDPGVYVTKIAPNGCADIDGRLRVDDQILAVNGISLEHVTNLEAVQTVKRAGHSLQLVVRRYLVSQTLVSGSQVEGSVQPSTARTQEIVSDAEESGETPIWFEVELRKPTPDTSLGLSIANGQTDEFNAPSDMDAPNMGLYVTRIARGGLAHRDGRVMPGDQLMQINGLDVSHLSRQDAVEQLRHAGQTVRLVFTRFQEQEADEQYGGSEAGASNAGGYKGGR